MRACAEIGRDDRLKKIITFVFSLLIGWGALVGCERTASPTLAPPGELPTPRVSTEMVVTQTAVPEAFQVQASPTAPPIPSPTQVLSSATPVRATATAAPIDTADAAAIAQIERGRVVLVETGKLMPFYRTNRELRNYQTAAWTYIIDAQSHWIVEILSVHETAVSEGSQKDIAELEQIARQFIAKASPDTKLDGLRPNHSSQTSNYLFRWEDHRVRVMDDGLTYPYIQVALSASGQMLNYFNTLVFIE